MKELGEAMAEQKNSLLQKLADAIYAMDVDLSEELARMIVEAGLFTTDVLENSIVRGMGRASRAYEEGEYFIPELLVCADAADAAPAIFQPCLKESPEGKGRMVIGSIRGDTHDIGKNIVALVVRSAGYEVFDLGRDIRAEVFVDAAESVKADVIAMASLMTTSMNHMAEVTGLLEQRGLRKRYVVMVGGKPLSRAFARKIGADFYAENAGSAVRYMEKVMQEKAREGRSKP